MKRDDISWYELRDAFLDNGGDGVYAAWQLTYLEPMFKDFNLLGREEFISQENIDSYRRGLCPNAEYLQPRIFQFKTNYWEEEKIHNLDPGLTLTIQLNFLRLVYLILDFHYQLPVMHIQMYLHLQQSS